MPLYQKSKNETKKFCDVEREYMIVPSINIKGGYNIKAGIKKYSEAMIREEFEKQLKILLKK